jgi:hypothetical protein
MGSPLDGLLERGEQLAALESVVSEQGCCGASLRRPARREDGSYAFDNLWRFAIARRT